jgi:hypothetical protein
VCRLSTRNSPPSSGRCRRCRPRRDAGRVRRPDRKGGLKAPLRRLRPPGSISRASSPVARPDAGSTWRWHGHPCA